MNSSIFKELIFQSLSNPSAAAARIIGMKLSRDVLWSGFLLTVVLNVLVVTLLTPPPPPNALQPDEMQMMVRLFNAPVMLALMSGGVFVILIFLLDWVGRIIGGNGDFGDILAAITWIQVLTLLSRIVIIALLYIVPAIASLALIAIWGLTLWITLHFLKVAHGFANLGQAVATLLFTTFGLAFGILTFLTLIGSLYKGFAG
ncbi:hypothetical protein A9Q95_01805 [Rhodobacterales bacterium 59_46_T64]|nr:hypothetical protein A9Q95_01805 [Rhodobacterales bacterium 59_46_T64]